MTNIFQMTQLFLLVFIFKMVQDNFDFDKLLNGNVIFRLGNETRCFLELLYKDKDSLQNGKKETRLEGGNRYM